MDEHSSLPSPKAVVPAAPYSYEFDRVGQSAQPISHYLWIASRYRWKIAGFVLCAVTATLVISSRLTRVYESTATVDVDRQAPAGIIGQEANRTPVSDADQFLSTQAKLIQSDSVLRPVARQYRLIGRQEAASAREDVLPLLKQLRVTRPPNTYLLQISYRSPDARLAADVANSVAQSYVEHTYDIRLHSSAALAGFMERQLTELKAKMDRSSAALAGFERELNLINPDEKTSIASARLLQLNSEYTTAQSDRMRRESVWKAMQSGLVGAVEISSQGEVLKNLSSKVDEARRKFSEIRAHYGSSHPEYLKMAAQVEELERQLREGRENAIRRVEAEFRESLNRENMLRTAVAQTKAEFDRVNARTFEYQARKREAETDKALYDELVRKIREASINAGFQGSAIRIADPALPASRPVLPDVALNVLTAFVASGFLAFGIAVMSERLDKSVREPEQVASLFQSRSVGTLPFVGDWRGRPASALAGTNVSTALLRSDRPVAAAAGIRGFEEAVRAVRNSILLGNSTGPLRSLMVTSATSAEGKTTTAVNLAIAHARQNHKTLLIDCDLRRPGVHTRLGIDADAGLASALCNGMQWRGKRVRFGELPELDVLPAGNADLRAIDLIGGALSRILNEAAHEYELVIVDAPPILGFPEPLQMAAAVDGVLMVTKAGATHRKSVGSALQSLEQVRANVLGLVLNGVTRDLSENCRYYLKD
ncbi:MAG: polysaccharide biosynthesis tyrosine autokinase [Bryobacteraceae bacterium]